MPLASVAQPHVSCEPHTEDTVGELLVPRVKATKAIVFWGMIALPFD